MTYIKLGVALGLALLVASLLALAFWYRGQAISAEAERDKVKADLAMAVTVNQSQKDAIDKLTTFRARDDAILVDLQKQLADINQDAQETQDALDKVKDSDPAAKSFLDTPVPDNVGGLLK